MSDMIENEDSVTGKLWLEQFGFCACGSPNDVLHYIADVLDAIKQRSDCNFSDESNQRFLSLIGEPSPAGWLTLYFLDHYVPRHRRSQINQGAGKGGGIESMRLKSLDEIKNPRVREMARQELAARENLDIEVIIPVRPVPKGRPRIGRGGHAFTPQRTRDYEAAVSAYMRAAMRGRSPMVGPVCVTVTISKDGSVLRFLPLANHSGSKLRGDVDNYVKALLDAANGIIVADDKQVVRITAEKN